MFVLQIQELVQGCCCKDDDTMRESFYQGQFWIKKMRNKIAGAAKHRDEPHGKYTRYKEAPDAMKENFYHGLLLGLLRGQQSGLAYQSRIIIGRWF